MTSTHSYNEKPEFVAPSRRHYSAGALQGLRNKCNNVISFQATTLGDEFATKFTEMFELSCNGRWPHLNHRCYTPTVEEEIEDIRIRVAEPRHLPTLDDLNLAQEEILEPSDIRKYEPSYSRSWRYSFL